VIDRQAKTMTCKHPDGKIIFERKFGKKWPAPDKNKAAKERTNA
jgi:hypothetical protein